MHLMVLGTMSNVGKSTLAMVLCRYFTKKGLDVVPFKSQNISRKFVPVNNGRIATAQYLQALSCEKEPSVEYNPILLIPENNGVEVYFTGEFIGHLGSEKYMYESKERLLAKVLEILKNLSESHDLVIIEGAGAAIEPNLKDTEIVNMRIATSVAANVILIADISKGGAFAQVVGTLELMSPDERKLVKGFLFNKFFGDKSLLKEAPDELAKKYSIEYFGTIPYFENRIPDEDVIDTKQGEFNLENKKALMEEIDRITEFVVDQIDISKIEKIVYEELSMK